MLDLIILFFFQNILLVTLLFWGLFFIGQKFFQTKQTLQGTEWFECGFLSYINFFISINLNAVFITLFLILYDVEFLFLVPVFYNFSTLTLSTFFIFCSFLVLVISSFLYDWQLTIVNWYA